MRARLTLLLPVLTLWLGACAPRYANPDMGMYRNQNMAQYQAWSACVADYANKMRAKGYKINSSVATALSVCEPEQRVYQTPLLDLSSRAYFKTMMFIEKRDIREEVMRQLIDYDPKPARWRY